MVPFGMPVPYLSFGSWLRRWLISESSCCPVLVWILHVWWSSPVVSVPGWQGGVVSCLCGTQASQFAFSAILSALLSNVASFVAVKGC